MFRLFRALRENSLSKRNFVKYIGYALGEIVLIVVGILIALQLDNWNQKRTTMAQADIWRAAIVDDLRSTQRNLGWRITYYEQTLAFAEIALPALQKNEPLSAEQNWGVVLGAFQAGQIMPFLCLW